MDHIRRKTALLTSVLHPEVMKVYFDMMSAWKAAGVDGFARAKAVLTAASGHRAVHDPFLVQVELFEQLLSCAKEEYMVREWRV